MATYFTAGVSERRFAAAALAAAVFEALAEASGRASTRYGAR